MALNVWVTWFRPALTAGNSSFSVASVAGAGDGAVFAQGFDEIQGAGELGREGHLRDELAVFKDGLPFLGGGCAAVFGVLRARAYLINERPFHVNANDARAAEGTVMNGSDGIKGFFDFTLRGG